MSASREKKQRQDGVDSNLTEKQRRDLKAEQTKKRNKITYTAIGVVAVVAVAALLVWNSGFFQKQAVAATVNDLKFTSAQMTYYYGSARQQEMQMSSIYQQFGMAYFDSNKAASAQIQDVESGKTYAEYFQEQALTSLKQVVALSEEAKAEGMTLSDEGKEGIDTSIASMKQYAAQSNVSLSVYLKAVYGKHMTESIFRAEAARAALAGEYQEHKSDSFTYSAEEIEAYYNENAADMDTYDYYFAQIGGPVETTTDADGNAVAATEEETAAAMADFKAKADAMAVELESGADFAATAAKYVSETEMASYEADPEYHHNTNDLGSAISGSSYGQWLIGSAHKSGDVTVVEDTANNCYFVVKFVNRWRAEDTYGTVDARHILVKAALDEGASEPTEAQYEAAKARIEELKAEWESGPKTADSFGQLAALNSDDTGSKADGGLIKGITRNQTVTNFNDFLFTPGRQAGDVGVVQNTASGQAGYHLIYIDTLGEVNWKYTATEALRSADYTAWYESVEPNYDAQPVAEGMSQLTK